MPRREKKRKKEFELWEEIYYNIFRIYPLRKRGAENVTRTKLTDGVYLTYLPARKFKTSLLSAQFVTPLAEETASAYALLPAVLRRGTVTYPDMGALSARLDKLYGARIDYTEIGRASCRERV